MFDLIINLIIVFLAGMFAYMSVHCAEEQRQGRTIRLPWERKQDNGE